MRHRRRTSRLSRRAAFTLTETLIVISLIAMISTGAAVLIGSLMALDGSAGAEAVEQLARSRLRQQFCADVHAATSATINTTNAGDAGEPTSQTLTLSFPDGRTVEYQATADAVEFIVRDDVDVVSRERYRMRGEKTFSQQEDSAIVSLTQFAVTSSATDADDLQEFPELALRIDAALGWNHRHNAVMAAEDDER